MIRGLIYLLNHIVYFILIKWLYIFYFIWLSPHWSFTIKIWIQLDQIFPGLFKLTVDWMDDRNRFKIFDMTKIRIWPNFIENLTSHCKIFKWLDDINQKGQKVLTSSKISKWSFENILVFAEIIFAILQNSIVIIFNFKTIKISSKNLHFILDFPLRNDPHLLEKCEEHWSTDQITVQVSLLRSLV